MIKQKSTLPKVKLVKWKFIDSPNAVPPKGKRSINVQIDGRQGMALDNPYTNIQPQSNNMGNAFTYPGSPLV